MPDAAFLPSRDKQHPAANIPEGSTFIRKIAADGSVTTVAGNYRGESGPAGTISTVAGPVARFQVLNGIAVDSSGNLYVTDESNHMVSRVTQSGAVTLIAGKSGGSGSVDEPATQ